MYKNLIISSTKNSEKKKEICSTLFLYEDKGRIVQVVIILTRKKCTIVLAVLNVISKMEVSLYAYLT
jgi:hypothetical protein